MLQKQQEVANVAGMRFGMTVAVLGLLATPLGAQTEKFEVASIKPCRPAEPSNGAGRAASGQNSAGPTPGRLDIECVTLISLIRTYIGRSEPVPTPIEGGPKWLDSDKYSVHAKAEGAPTVATLRGPMLQALLTDRFQLR